jgi:putative ABC transport system permease protein
MLARTTVRQRELSIRQALGAGRARLLRQLAIESLVLAAFGGALGVLLAVWGIDSLPAALEARLPSGGGLQVDASVLMFSLGATLLTAVFFGVAPALQAVSGSSSALQETSRAVSASPRSRRLRGAIAVAEIALAVVVVIGAGLLARSFAALTSRDPGFDASHLLTFNVQFIHEPDDKARARAADAVLERLRQIPSVDAAGGSSGFPVVTAQRGTRFAAEGRTLTPDQDSAYFMAATPDYFRALGTPVVQGRPFTARDGDGAPGVVIVNLSFADTVFGGDDALGKRIKLINPDQSPDWRTIVGIVGNLYYQGAAGEAGPSIYTPFAQTPFMWAYVMVRTTGDPAAITNAVRAAVPAVVTNGTAANIRPMRDIMVDAVAEPRLTMMLTGAFGLLALLLSGVGIYGVISYTVAQRTREIGIRRVLGAHVGDVVRLVVGEGLLLGTLGVGIGLAAASAVMTWTSTLLFGVTAHDPATYAGVGAILLTVAAVASWIPARRALRVEPLVALRQE